MVSWGSSLATAGLLWADTLILGRMTTTEDVGVYTVATQLVMLAVFVMAPINAAFAPQIARLYHRGDITRLGEVYAAATAWILRIALPALVLLLIFPIPLLRLVGDDYLLGAGVTMTLAVGRLINDGTGPCATVLNMRVVQVRRGLGLLPFGAVTVKSTLAALAAGGAGWAVRCGAGHRVGRVASARGRGVGGFCGAWYRRHRPSDAAQRAQASAPRAARARCRGRPRQQQ